MPTETELKRIYKGLAFTTSSEAQMKINADLRSRKLLKYWAVTTLVVFPAIISFLGWSTPVFAAISLIYAWYKCADKWLAINGQKIKSEAEVAKEEEQRLMEHHHYHCVRNPEAFDKLKHENFRINQARKRDDKLELMESSFLEQN
ncbi:hypothetical protein [Vibrio cortegadensis]|uniref:hypothetical protein n=1 Tax=Vibrio cortegadensis TaxID=1328770 RepID=UPI0021C3C8F5|nr:hypothetical protein [Vibrio cortegadensis]